MNTKWVTQLGILIILLSACSTNISTPIATATSNLFPTQTTVSITPIKLELNACVATEEAIRIRSGPGTDYEAIGALAAGACITILERSPDSSWVYMATADDFTGWVAAWLLTIDGDLSKVAVQNERDNFAVATQSPQFQSIQPCANIANLLGSTVTCKIETAYCVYLPDADGSPTFCTDKPDPNHLFQFVVFGEDWSEYNGICMTVTGLLESHFNGQKGLLQIVGHDRSQVSACE
jgi:uncharacterized protein YgiM (DUF1202 family)